MPQAGRAGSLADEPGRRQCRRAAAGAAACSFPGRKSLRTTVTTAVPPASLVAAPASPAADSYAFGNRALAVGDPVGRLAELAGPPVHKEVVENEFGAQVAETWEYRRDGKSLLITVKDGKAQQIRELH